MLHKSPHSLHWSPLVKKQAFHSLTLFPGCTSFQISLIPKLVSLIPKCLKNWGRTVQFGVTRSIGTRSTLTRSTCHQINSHEINLPPDQLSRDQLWPGLLEAGSASGCINAVGKAWEWSLHVSILPFSQLASHLLGVFAPSCVSHSTATVGLESGSTNTGFISLCFAIALVSWCPLAYN